MQTFVLMVKVIINNNPKIPMNAIMTIDTMSHESCMTNDNSVTPFIVGRYRVSNAKSTISEPVKKTKGPRSVRACGIMQL